jgi:hypothetical protein
VGSPLPSSWGFGSEWMSDLPTRSLPQGLAMWWHSLDGMSPSPWRSPIVRSVAFHSAVVAGL